MESLHIFIRIDDEWTLDDYKDHVKQQIIAFEDVSVKTVFISNDNDVLLNTSIFDTISQVIAAFQKAEPKEVSLESHISDFELKDILADPYINRLSLMGIQDEDAEQIKKILDLCAEQDIRTNIDWDFTKRFSGSDIEQLINYGSNHISIYGLEDEEEFEQVSIALWSEGYENYDDYHFAKNDEKSEYLKACRYQNDEQATILGIGPDAKSTNIN